MENTTANMGQCDTSICLNTAFIDDSVSINDSITSFNAPYFNDFSILNKAFINSDWCTAGIDDSVFLEPNLVMAHKAPIKLDGDEEWKNRSRSESSISQITLYLPPKRRSSSSFLKVNSNQEGLVRGSFMGNGTGSEDKFRIRKVGDYGNFKKGPLKAVIPFSNMSRRKIPIAGLQLLPINLFNVKPGTQSPSEGSVITRQMFKPDSSTKKTINLRKPWK